VIVELDHDAFFTAGQDRSKAELGVFDLGALREFSSHRFLSRYSWVGLMGLKASTRKRKDFGRSTTMS
jgi:hypothetical protein